MQSGFSHETLGLSCALLTALFWAVAVVLFKKSGDVMDPIALNTFKNVLALALMLATGLVLGFERGSASMRDMVYLTLSGVVGIGVADTLLFFGLNEIGASRQAIVDTLYSPAVLLFSFVMHGEVLAPGDALGGALIFGAVVLATFPVGGTVQLEPGRLTRGILASALSILLMALAIVVVKPILETNDVLFCTTLRLMGGTMALGLASLLHPRTRRAVGQAFVPRRAWRYAVPGALMGTYFSLLLWIGAFKYAPAGVAALLNQTSTLFIVLLAAVFLREPLTGRVLGSALLALSGSVLVLL